MRRQGFLLYFLYFILSLPITLVSWSCEEILKNYPLECGMQDRYRKLKNEFSEKYEINVEELALYRSLRFIARKDLNAKKAEENSLPWHIYSPEPKTWMLWEAGAKATEELREKLFNNSSKEPKLTLDELKELHKATIDHDLVGLSSRILLGSDPGFLRNRFYHLPPSYAFSCEEKVTEEMVQLIKNYDIKDKKGNSYIKGKFFKCPDGVHFRGFIVYLNSSAVEEELQELIKSYNHYWAQHLKGVTQTESPLEFVADIQRWYVSIHPFREGNGRLSRFLQDLFLKGLGLPFTPAGDLTDDVLESKTKYRTTTKLKMEESIDSLEGCLKHYNKKEAEPEHEIPRECLPLYSNFNLEKNEKLKVKKEEFKIKLDEFLKKKDCLPK